MYVSVDKNALSGAMLNVLYCLQCVRMLILTCAGSQESDVFLN